MISNELKNLLVQIITSWQVLGVTLVLIAYFSLVSYVARFRHTFKVAKAKSKPKPKKEKKAATNQTEDEKVKAT
jgi:Na+-transporting methylmalonyl-CoA/oxaloacetate decarboxylase gamma subunit